MFWWIVERHLACLPRQRGGIADHEPGAEANQAEIAPMNSYGAQKPIQIDRD